MNKTSMGMRGWFILIVLGLSLFSLYPSYQVHSLPASEKQAYLKNNPKVAQNAVNFGLDLAGGTNIVVEIDKSGLKDDDAADIQERSLEIVRNRVDQFGLSEPVISPSGDNRVVAELAGVDVEMAKGLIGETALLEFKLVVPQERFVEVLNLIDGHLKRQGGAKDTTVADSLPLDSAGLVADSIRRIDSLANLSAEDLLAGGSARKDTATDTVNKDAVVATKDSSDTAGVDSADKGKLTDDLAAFRDLPFSSFLRPLGGDVAVAEGEIEKVKQLLANPGVAALIPRDVEFAWGRGFEEQTNGDKFKKLYLLKHRAEMDGKEIADAQPNRINDGLSAGQIAVNLRFKGLGPKKFASVTGNNVGRQMAIVLDDQVISAPVIKDRIPNGEAVITGLEDMQEAKQLSVVLRAGALPAPMKIIELRSVGASLGEDNIKNGVFAAVMGMFIVLAFMAVYYKTAGWLANVAVLFNIILIGSVLSMFNATLTLPGIAGIVLTIGMAVDANVIIYERIREELAAGKLARAAVSAGYEKAFSTIFDSNITTFLTAFILYKIGTGPIKGFGLTLMIGIAASMFTALVVTRSIFDGVLARKADNTVDVGKGFRFFNEANLPVMAKRKVFIGISLTLIAISFGSMATRWFEFSTDFTGGHVLTVQFADEARHSDDIASAMASQGLSDAKVRTLSGTGANQYLVTLKGDIEGKVEVREKVQSALSAKNLSFEIVNEEIVGPTIGKELRKDALWAVFLSWLIIILYIWVRFGRMGLGFGVGAVIALIHDVIITLGVFSLFQLPVDAALIAAVLTIVGYSINDTIVLYDRIRENTQTLGKDSFETKVNLSVNQSLSRTIITSATTFFVTVVLAIRGGASIQDFGIAMSVGIVVGTWSSIFIASPFVVWWNRRFQGGLR